MCEIGDSMALVEIKCKKCGRLLGKFEGKGEIKCRKVECGTINRFDTETGEQTYVVHKHTPMKARKSSSGMTFGY